MTFYILFFFDEGALELYADKVASSFLCLFEQNYHQEDYICFRANSSLANSSLSYTHFLRIYYAYLL